MAVSDLSLVYDFTFSLLIFRKKRKAAAKEAKGEASEVVSNS